MEITNDTNFKTEELRGFGNKSGGMWTVFSYIDRGDKRIIISVAHNKSRKVAMKEAMLKGVERCDSGSQE